MDHVVKLNSIPDPMEFPSDLKNRVRFDPIKKQLIFRGFMSKSDYDRLANLHDDVHYRRAIENLFRISTEYESSYYALVKYTLIALAVICLILGVVVWWQLLQVPMP